MDPLDSAATRLGLRPIDPPTRLDPTEADLARFDREIGGRLPDDYRAFLARHGRTGPRGPTVFPVREPGPLGEIASFDQFFGFSTTDDDIVNQTLDTYAGRIPDETIPIGSDAGGNLILLGFEGAATDRVWFWDHEHLELEPGALERMYADLEAAGRDISTLDPHAAIYYWERLDPSRLAKLPGYGNLYAVADHFLEFLESLRPDPAYQ